MSSTNQLLIASLCASRDAVRPQGCSRCYDPDDPDIFELYFGRKPTADELDQLQLEGGILEWPVPHLHLDLLAMDCFQ